MQREYAEARKTGRFIDLDDVSWADKQKAEQQMKEDDAEEAAAAQRAENELNEAHLGKLDAEVVGFLSGNSPCSGILLYQSKLARPFFGILN